MSKPILFILMSFTFLNADIQCSGISCSVNKDMTFWGINLYHFSYLIEDTGNERIKLTYKRKIEKSKNVEKTIEKFSENNEDSTKWEKLLGEWNSHLIDVKEGTVYEVVVDGCGATMFIDNKKLFHTQQRVFGEKYIKIWSGKNPVDEGLRDEIVLAKSKIKSKLKTLAVKTSK